MGGGTNGGNDLTFENDPKTRLVIEKYITGTTVTTTVLPGTRPVTVTVPSLPVV